MGGSNEKSGQEVCSDVAQRCPRISPLISPLACSIETCINVHYNANRSIDVQFTRSASRAVCLDQLPGNSHHAMSGDQELYNSERSLSGPLALDSRSSTFDLTRASSTGSTYSIGSSGGHGLQFKNPFENVNFEFPGLRTEIWEPLDREIAQADIEAYIINQSTEVPSDLEIEEDMALQQLQQYEQPDENTDTYQDISGDYELARILTQEFEAEPASLSKENVLFQYLYEQPTADVTYQGVSLSLEYLLECKELWSLSLLFKWVQGLPELYGKTLLGELEICKHFMLLISFYFPNFEDSELSELVNQIVSDFKQSGCFEEAFNNQIFINNESWVSGVIPRLLTCYSTYYNHMEVSFDDRLVSRLRCYDTSCHFNKKQPVDLPKDSLSQTWLSYWKISNEELRSLDRAQIEKNMTLFELISTASRDVENHRKFVRTVGEDFKKKPASLVSPMKADVFYQIAFDSIARMADLKEKYLLNPLREVIASQGKFITSGYCSPYLTWLDNIKTVYKLQVKNKCALAIYINFEREKPGSKFYQWYTQHNDYVSQKNFSNVFVDDAIILLPTFKKLGKFVDPDSEEGRQINKVTMELKQFAHQLNRWKEEFDTSLLVDKITFGKGIAPVTFEPNTVILIENSAKLKLNMGVNLYLLLFDFVFLVCEVDFNKHKYRVVQPPIPTHYIHAIGKKKQRSSSHRISFGGPAAAPQDELMTQLKIYNMATQNSLSVFVFNGQEKEWVRQIAQAHDARKSKLLSLGPFRMKFVALGTTSYESLSTTRSLVTDVSKIVPTEPWANQHVLSSAIFSAATVNMPFGEFTIVGLNNGICIGHKRAWRKMYSFDNVRKMEHMPESKVFVFLASKKLQCFHSADLDVYASKELLKEISLPLTLISKDVMDFCVVREKNTEALYYLKGNSASVLLVKVAMPKFKKFFEPINVTIVAKTRYTDLAVKKVSQSAGRLYLHTTEKQFLRLPELLVFPHIMQVGSSSTSDSKISSLLLMHQSLRSALTVAVFSLASEETLVVLDKMAVFCKDTGYFSRAEFIEFGGAIKAAAMQDEHLVVVSKTEIEVYEVASIGPKAGRLVQVISGTNMRLVESLGRVKVVSILNNNSQILFELIKK